MVNELITVFENMKEKTGADPVIDSYVPDSGTYILVGQNGEIKARIEVSIDKKNEEIIMNGDSSFKEEIFIRDYLSKILSPSKAMDKKKKIHSNNPFAVFVKKDVLKNGLITEDLLKGYYDDLASAKENYRTVKKRYEMYEQAEKIVGKYPKEEADICQNWIMDHFFDLDIDLAAGKYLKIFFDQPADMYEKEYKRYLYPKLFLKNEHNRTAEGEVYGLPGNNFNLNKDKPFLQHKGRKIPEPALILMDHAIREKELFDYLMNLANLGYYNIFFDTIQNEIYAFKDGILPEDEFSGYFIRIKRGQKMEVDIVHSQVISCYQPYLEKPFTLHNDTNIKDEEIYIQCETKQEFHDLINEIIFSYQLKNCYFMDFGSSKELPEIMKSNPVLKTETVRLKDMLFQYFYGDSEMNKDLLLDSLFRIILSTVSSGHMKKAALQMNLYLSLRRYYEKNSIEPYYLWEKCLKKIYVEEENEGKNNIFFDEEEWHFSLGRMLKIMSRSMTFNTEQMFLLLKDKKHFSRNFRMLVRKHIKLDSYMQKRLYYMLLDPKQRLDQNLIWIIIAGVLYEK